MRAVRKHALVWIYLFPPFFFVYREYLVTFLLTCWTC